MGGYRPSVVGVSRVVAVAPAIARIGWVVKRF
jgi:hypothetical protein